MSEAAIKKPNLVRFINVLAAQSGLATILLVAMPHPVGAADTNHVSSMRTHAPSSRDVNGVNLGTGQFMPPPVSTTIGNDISSLTESITGSDFPTGSVFGGGITFADPYSLSNEKQFALTLTKDESYVRVYFGDYNKAFYCDGTQCTAEDGSMDKLEGGTWSPNTYFYGPVTLTTSNGTIAHFSGLDLNNSNAVTPSDFIVDARFAILTKLVKPDGETIHLIYNQTQKPSGYDSTDQMMGLPPEFFVSSYIENVYSSLGFTMWGSAFDYSTGYTLNNSAAPSGTSGIGILGTGGLSSEYELEPEQNGLQVGSPYYYYYDGRQVKGVKAGLSGGNDAYSYHEKVDDRYRTICKDDAWSSDEFDYSSNRTWELASPTLGFSFNVCAQVGYDRFLHQAKIKNTSGSIRYLVDYYTPMDAVGFNQIGFIGGCRGQTARIASETCVKTVTRVGRVWKYTWAQVGTTGVWRATIENPTGGIRTVDTTYDTIYGTRVHSDTDELGRVTQYEYDDGIHLSKVTFDEGNYTTYEYDKNRLTHVREYPKGGGTPKLTQALYPSTCDAATAKICNQPTWVRDPIGNLPENIGNPDYRTDYTYHPEHGGIATETLPPAANGVRAQTRYTYEQKPGFRLIPNQPALIWRLIRTSTCGSSTNSCAGTADETVTEYAYDHPNLFMTAKTVRAGNANILAPHSDTNVWQTTAFGYDWIGNTVMVDGPLPGDVDKSYATYDGNRQKVYEIGPDPDGTGPLRRVVLKHTYNYDRLLIKTENGTASGVTFTSNLPSGVTDFVVTSVKDMAYVPETGQLLKTTLIEK